MRQASAGTLKMSLNLEGAHTIKARDQGPNRGHNRDASGQRDRGKKSGERDRDRERERSGETEGGRGSKRWRDSGGMGEVDRHK